MGRTPRVTRPEDSDLTLATAPARRRARPAALRPMPLNSIDFAATIAHDMRAPIATIATSAEMLEQDLGLAESNHLISVILRQTHRLQFMIQDLAEYSNIKSGQVSLHPEVIDLSELVREVCTEF